MSLNEKSLLYENNWIPGVVVDEVTTFEVWCEKNNTLLQMQEEFRDLSIMELICELVNIFEKGFPNTFYLLQLFGDDYDYKCGELIARYGLKTTQKMQEEFERKNEKGRTGLDDSDEIIVYVKEIDNKLANNGLEKVELKININTFNIDELYLFINKVVNMDLLISKLKGISTNIKTGLDKFIIIYSKTYKIIICEMDK